MWYATTVSTAASVASGMKRAHLPRKTSTSSTSTACVMPATGVRPPFLTLVAVRAMAPVAGMPPKRPDAMLAMPWATSSTLDLWRLPIMPSATTAESSDSIAASSATVTAGEKSSRTRSSVTAGRLRRRDRGVDLAEARADRLDRAGRAPRRRPTRRGSRRSARAPCARPSARRTRIASDPAATPIAGSDAEPRCAAYASHFARNVRRHRAHLQPEQVLDLRGEDDDGDPAREAGDDGVRDELDRAAEPGEAHRRSAGRPRAACTIVRPSRPYCVTMP